MSGSSSELAAITALLRGKRISVLSGAGISTESGIPDYRGPETARRARKPIRFQEYAASAEGRARYWARSMLGFPTFSSAQPNAAHRALAELEAAGHITGIVTQNVDRLHQAAGSRAVIELHGALAEVRCLRCDEREARSDLQQRLEAMNPHLLQVRAELGPDGDTDLGSAWLTGFRVPSCLSCDGVLKPNVVFFGENVAKPIVSAAFELVDAADVLLVLGSSLTVYSGYRFVKHAHARSIPIGLITLGATRADTLASVRIDGKLGDVLPQIAASLLGRG